MYVWNKAHVILFNWNLNKEFNWFNQPEGCLYNVWAMAWQNQRMTYVPSEDSDQPGHPLISLCCPHEESLGSKPPIERTEDW